MKCASVMLKPDSFLSIPTWLYIKKRAECVRMRTPGSSLSVVHQYSLQISVSFTAIMSPIEIFYNYFTFIRVS